MKNANLYNASYHLYKAATFLGEIDQKVKNQLLDMAKGFLDEVEITEESIAAFKEIDKYAKIIKGEE